MPADLERIFQVAHQRKNWREPSAQPPPDPPAQVPSRRAAPLHLRADQILAQLEDAIAAQLGPKAKSMRVQLAVLRAACAPGAETGEAADKRVQKALDELEDLLEALALIGR